MENRRVVRIVVRSRIEVFAWTRMMVVNVGKVVFRATQWVKLMLKCPRSNEVVTSEGQGQRYIRKIPQFLIYIGAQNMPFLEVAHI